MTATLQKICAHFGACGGCSRQDLAYEAQLRQKEALVKQHLAEWPLAPFHPIFPSPASSFYRNKMEFSFGDHRDLRIINEIRTRKADVPLASVQGQVHLGLHPKRQFSLVTPTPDCLLQSEESQQICAIVSAWATRHNIPIYFRNDGSGVLRHLAIREGKNTNERMVVLYAKSETPHMDELAENLKAGPRIDTFVWGVNDGLSDVAQGSEARIFWGNGFIYEKVGGLYFKVSASSFMQTNTHASEKMIDLLKNWMGEAQILVDLYCGAGAIGLNLKKDSVRLIGIELNPQAIEDARANAVYNGIFGAEFHVGRVEHELTRLPRSDRERTTVVVDPPRAGLDKRVADALVEFAAPQLFYVSCNPETLARDLRVLGSKYRIADVQPMDFFPHTDHVETAVRLNLS